MLCAWKLCPRGMEVLMLALCLGSYLIVTLIATLFLWSALHTARQADRRQYRLVRQLKSMPYDDTEA